jgi:hypothetical protein
MSMRLLRTDAGEFINAAAIVPVYREGDGIGWLAVLADGAEIPLAPYYSVPGRIEQDFPHLVRGPAAAALPTAAVCLAEACCAQLSEIGRHAL